MPQLEPSVYFLLVYILALSFSLLKGMKLKTIVLQSILFWYLAALVIVTLLPGLSDGAELELKNNFVPLKTIVELVTQHPTSVALRQVVGNVVLFIPFGFLLPLLWPSLSFSKKILLGLSLSFGIEALQYVISLQMGYTYRITDIDDLLLTTVGFIIGLICFRGYSLWATSPCSRSLS